MLGYKPHKKQVLFHQSMNRKKLYIGGNRSGKTTGGVIEDLWWLTHRHPYRKIPSDIPIHGRALAVDFSSVDKILISAIQRWILPSDLIGGSWDRSYSVSNRTLTLANDSTLEFKTYDQEVQQMAGTSRHFIHFDEPPPKVLFAENKMRLLDRYGDFNGSGSWWMTYTPIFGMDWTYDEVYLPGKNDPDGSGITVIEVDMTDNPYLSEEAIAHVLNGLSEDEVTARKHGKYVQVGGNVFKEFGPAHVITEEADIFRLWNNNVYPPSDWLIYSSMDHGLNAPTAWYWHAVGSDGTIITFQEHYKAEMVIEDHAKIVHEIERKIGRTPDFRVGDPAIKQRSGITGTSVQQEYMAKGICISVDSIPKDPSIGITKMRQHMRINPKTKAPYWRIFNCPNLVRELQRIHWKTYTSLKIRDDNNPLEQVHKKDDHGFDSCKYFFTFMPDLKPEADGALRSSDFTPGSLAATMFEQPVPVPGPISWQVTQLDNYDPLGLEEID